MLNIPWFWNLYSMRQVLATEAWLFPDCSGQNWLEGGTQVKREHFHLFSSVTGGILSVCAPVNTTPNHSNWMVWFTKEISPIQFTCHRWRPVMAASAQSAVLNFLDLVQWTSASTCCYASSNTSNLLARLAEPPSESAQLRETGMKEESQPPKTERIDKIQCGATQTDRCLNTHDGAFVYGPWRHQVHVGSTHKVQHTQTEDIQSTTFDEF